MPAIAPARPVFVLEPERPEIAYVAALMLKAAEQVTLSTLQDECSGAVYPLLTVIRRPRKTSRVNDAGYRKYIEPPTLDQHVRNQCAILKEMFAPSLFDRYGISRAMLDVSYLDAQHNESTLSLIESILVGEKRDIVPVVSFEQLPGHALAARRWNKSYLTGLALRVRRHHRTRSWPKTSEVLPLLSECGSRPADTDLVVDAGHLRDAADAERSLVELVRLTAELHAMGPWRTVTALSGAFPRSIGTLALDKTHRLKRWDFITWKRLRFALRERRVPCPIYGDYGMVFPIPANGGTPPLANLRYTDEHEFLVRRREQEPAMRDVCRAICAENWYCGSGFSHGDAWIDRVARNLDGPGNGEIWNRTGLQHHVVFVVRQLLGLT